jgi:hypothetical protein
MQKKTLSSALILGLTGVLALAGCKKHDDAAATASVPAAETPVTDAATTPAAVAVSAISVGNTAAPDKSVAPLATLGNKDKVIVSIKTDGAASNVNVAAKLIYQDGQVAGEQHATLNTAGAETTNIEFSNANPWPAGKYTAEVSVDGSPAGLPQQFEIK